MLKRTIDLLLSSGLFTFDGLSGFFGLSPTDIEMLIDLPNYYFKGQASVVNLATLKGKIRDARWEHSHSTGGVIDFLSRKHLS